MSINKKIISVVLFSTLIILLCSCNKKSSVDIISEDDAVLAIKNYCYRINPDLESIVKTEEYPVYWEIISSDEHEIVVMFRSYTGAQNRYYINRNTGDTYVTEYVPGVTIEEQQTDEKFNINDFFNND